jgi:hypothetical protein
MSLEVPMDKLAELIFQKNVNDASIYIDLSELKNPKDLFFFMVHLMCKGLVLIYGNNGRVNFDELTLEGFANIKSKLRCIGIDCILTTDNLTHAPHGITYSGLESTLLSDMKLHVVMPHISYTIHFIPIHS